MNCDECLSGFYNFSGDGCNACECYEPGSEDIECNNGGNCVCKVRVLQYTQNVHVYTYIWKIYSKIMCMKFLNYLQSFLGSTPM